MKKSKLYRVLSLTLCFVMLITLFAGVFTASAVTDINTVSLTGYVAPVAGQKPNYNISVPSGAHYSSTRYGTLVKWVNVTTGKTLDSGDIFEAGYYYQLEVRLLADDGYQFPSGSGNVPATLATVNGKVAQTSYPTGRGSNKNELVVICGDAAKGMTIKSVEVFGLDVPVPGGYPDFSVSLGGSSYELFDTDPITWTDTTTSPGTGLNRYDNNARFVEGHTYSVSIWLQAKTSGGYFFATDSNWNSTVTGTLNSEPAKVHKAYDQTADEVIELIYTFTCETPTIDWVSISGLETPKADAVPDYNVTADHSTYRLRQKNDTLTKNGVRWVDRTDKREMNVGETFIAGHA